ncbi:DedA family protein [Saccharococcus caldoxylosilyticus]|uniref:DedA family protein n=1 Tax=Saccharococcus caldoxylosilyticus TaxID=81408 RepID=UPI001FCB657C|nr:DedA family protein [Parageobacillus caldoxylosilyticus]BDG42158.1 alkaline phosphatase [Parageobacillus caldoxylosilyticus]
MEHYLHYFINHFGYIGIMIVLMLGIVGMPIPDELLLTYVGYRISVGSLSYPIAFMCSFFGATIGISISYCLGVALGLPFLRKFGPKIHITEKRMEQTKTLFAKLGPSVLFICYFIPGIRHVAAFLAGANAYDWKKFMVYAYSGAFVWIFTFLAIGNYLGENWIKIKQYMDSYRSFFALFFIFLVVLLTLYWYYQQKKK